MENEKFEQAEDMNPAQAGGNSRDGYFPRNNENRAKRPGGRYNSEYTHRPRFIREENRERGDYRTGGGYGNGYNTGGYRPRNDENGNYERGYAPRPRYREGGEAGEFSKRPRFNNNRPSYSYNDDRRPAGYRPESRFNKRPGYNQSPSPEYGTHYDRPRRPTYNNEREDYQSAGRDGYQRPAGDGYRRFSYNGGSRPYRPYGNNQQTRYNPKKRLDYKEENLDPDQPIRLNKYLANAGVCSRRDADKYITAGVVTVNNEIVTELGVKVKRTDVVKFHDNPVSLEKKVYVLLNKPKGYVTTSEDPQNRKTVMDLVQGACPERIYPVGRLDRNTTGVLLLTNDGEMASKLTHPKFLKKKIYHVHTDQNVTLADMKRIAEGITLEDGEIRADAIEYASPTDKKQVGIEIHSGKNRIVRRIFESLGYHVVKLDRVYFAGLTKKNVRRGDWRYLTEKEVNMLRMGAFE